MKSFSSHDLGRIVAALIAATLCNLGCAMFGGEQSDPAHEVQAEILKQIVEEQQARRELQSTAFENPPPQTVESFLREGDGLREADDPARALWVYLKAHELDSSDPRPLLRIAGLHLGPEPERAVAIFSRLAAQHDDSAAPLTGLALALVAQGADPAAEEALRRAIDLDPDFPAARNALGIVLEQRAAHDEARDHFARAIALQPSSYEPLNNLGASYLATRDNAQALDAFQRAALLETRDPAVFNNMGVALGRLGRYDEALEAFLRAGPEHVAWNNLGWVRYEQADYSDAISAYERALLIARGEERLVILGNLLAARKALEREETEQPSEAAPSPEALLDPAGTASMPDEASEELARKALEPETEQPSEAAPSPEALLDPADTASMPDEASEELARKALEPETEQPSEAAPSPEALLDPAGTASMSDEAPEGLVRKVLEPETEQPSEAAPSPEAPLDPAGTASMPDEAPEGLVRKVLEPETEQPSEAAPSPEVLLDPAGPASMPDETSEGLAQ